MMQSADLLETKQDVRERCPLDDDAVACSRQWLMTRGFAHDLGNHLQVVRSALSLILRHGGADRDSIARQALEAVDRAAALERRILGCGVPGDVGNKLIELDKFMLGLVDRISWLAGPTIQVELVATGNVPKIRCNERDLENAVLNLVANARDAMPEGGHLRISSNCGGDPASPTVSLHIADNGCGMLPEMVHRAFQPLFTTKPDGKGFGLGLSRVFEFALSSGGEAQIESSPGMGTSVTLQFPVGDTQPSI